MIVIIVVVTAAIQHVPTHTTKYACKNPWSLYSEDPLASIGSDPTHSSSSDSSNTGSKFSFYSVEGLD